jgi:hypothetical protein
LLEDFFALTMLAMTPKKTLNLAIPAQLLEEFNEVCAHYGHGKQKGMVLSAAILMFLRANPHAQGEFLHEIMAADIAQGVKKMLAEKVDQAKRDSAASAQLKTGVSFPQGPIDASHVLPRKAAKKAGKAVRGLSKLPRLEDLGRKKKP